MGQEVVLQDVRMGALRIKIGAFATLHDAKPHDVKIAAQGTFKDKGGNLVFLNRDWHEVTFLGMSQHLFARLDGEADWTQIVPENGVISQVKLSIS